MHRGVGRYQQVADIAHVGIDVINRLEVVGGYEPARVATLQGEGEGEPSSDELRYVHVTAFS